ncbi:MAG: DUF2062 domain-containing protein [Nitrospirae bacterium]|nr:DUF2062 domain-containing protein [Nitrospirota bacterium]
MPSWLFTKIVSPVTGLLKQGLSPPKLAMVIALGITLSVFPVIGTTTGLCAVVALLFRLNLPAIQVANYAAFPLQIMLFFPFLEIGEAVSGNSLGTISEDTLVSAFNAGFIEAIQELSGYLLLACLGWAIAAVPLFFVVYFIMKPLLQKYGAAVLPATPSGS